MKKRTKRALIAAIVCIAAGAVLLIVTGLLCRFDPARLNTVDSRTTTYDVSDPFDSLDVLTGASDIRLRPSEDGACRVVCVENERLTHSVAVEDGTLRIRTEDTRDWKDHIAISWGDSAGLSVTVFLPESRYETLQLASASGEIDVPAGFAFAAAALESTSGEIAFTGTVDGTLAAGSTSGGIAIADTACDTLAVSSTSGEVELRGVTAALAGVGTTSGEAALSDVSLTGALTVSTVSGSQTLENVSADSLYASATSGTVTARAVFTGGVFSAGTTSGGIRLRGCDGGSLALHSTSGEITAGLTSHKNFSARSNSGTVDLPPSVPDAGACELETASGDITVTVGQS